MENTFINCNLLDYLHSDSQRCSLRSELLAESHFTLFGSKLCSMAIKDRVSGHRAAFSARELKPVIDFYWC